MQSEYKEKQEDTKGKLQSDVQCTVSKDVSHTTPSSFLAV